MLEQEVKKRKSKKQIEAVVEEVVETTPQIEEPTKKKYTEAEYLAAKKEVDELIDSTLTKQYALYFHTDALKNDKGSAKKANNKAMSDAFKQLDNVLVNTQSAFALVALVDALRKTEYVFDDMCYYINGDIVEAFMHFVVQFKTFGIERAREVVTVASGISRCVIERDELNKKIGELSTIVLTYETDKQQSA